MMNEGGENFWLRDYIGSLRSYKRLPKLRIETMTKIDLKR